MHTSESNEASGDPIVSLILEGCLRRGDNSSLSQTAN